jgi:hypothetical protein
VKVGFMPTIRNHKVVVTTSDAHHNRVLYLNWVTVNGELTPMESIPIEDWRRDQQRS